MAALVCFLFLQVARARKVGFEHSSPGQVHELALTRCSEAETMTWHTTSLQKAAAEMPWLGRIIGEWCVVVEQSPNILPSSRGTALAQCWHGTVYRVHKWVTHLTDNPGVFQVFGKPMVTYCEFTLQNQPKNLATAKQVSIDTAMQYCEVRMGGLAILPNRERRQCSSIKYQVCDMVRHRCSHL